MLRALYKDGNIPEGHMLKFEDLAHHYELDFQPGWLIELQKELLSDGLLKGPSNGRMDAQAIGRLTGPGMQEAERLIDESEDRGSILIDVNGPLPNDIATISARLAPAADRFVSLGDNSNLRTQLNDAVEEIEKTLSASR
jgi:hypothetical protein